MDLINLIIHLIIIIDSVAWSDDENMFKLCKELAKETKKHQRIVQSALTEEFKTETRFNITPEYCAAKSDDANLNRPNMRSIEFVKYPYQAPTPSEKHPFAVISFEFEGNISESGSDIVWTTNTAGPMLKKLGNINVVIQVLLKHGEVKSRKYNLKAKKLKKYFKRTETKELSLDQQDSLFGNYDKPVTELVIRLVGARNVSHYLRVKLIFCVNSNIAPCKIAYKNGGIFCDCGLEKEKNFFIFTVVVILILVLFLTIFPICYLKTKKVQKMDQLDSDRFLYILCNQKTTLYQYLIFLRFGCPTDDFNFQEAMIDFEFLSPDRAVMTQSRIKAEIFDPEEISEIQYVLCRMTPLTDTSLGFVSFVLTGAGNIYFYGVEIVDIISNHSFYFPVNKYVKTRKDMKQLVPDDPALVTKNTKGPKTPIPKMMITDIIVIIFFTSNVIALVCTLFINEPSFDTALIYAVVSSVIGGLIQTNVILVFLLIIKNMELKEKLVVGKSKVKYSMIFMVVIFALGLIIGIITIVFSKDKDLLNCFNTFATMILSLIIVLGVWKMIRTLKLFSKYTKRSWKIGKDGLSMEISIDEQSTDGSKLDPGSSQTSQIISPTSSIAPTSSISPASSISPTSTVDGGLSTLLSELDKQKQPKGLVTSFKTNNQQQESALDMR